MLPKDERPPTITENDKSLMFAPSAPFPRLSGCKYETINHSFSVRGFVRDYEIKHCRVKGRRNSLFTPGDHSV